MNLFSCLLTNNLCYSYHHPITPKGVMVHSTGANNPNLRRYVQPSEEAPNYAALREQLGVNPYHNDWNQPEPGGQKVCVHAFVGKLADGSIAAVQTLPWGIQGWHAGTGPKGSANDTHISFEICEDDLSDPAYFAQIYQASVELTAHLCRLYHLNPLENGVVICHREGYQQGTASDHADVLHWFPRHGKSMDDFRQAVSDELTKGQKEEPLPGELLWKQLQEYLATQPLPDWAKESYQRAVELGITDGTAPMQLAPRYQAALMVKNALERR